MFNTSMFNFQFSIFRDREEAFKYSLKKYQEDKQQARLSSFLFIEIEH